jgi:hypothetical protein
VINWKTKSINISYFGTSKRVAIETKSQVASTLFSELKRVQRQLMAPCVFLLGGDPGPQDLNCQRKGNKYYFSPFCPWNLTSGLLSMSETRKRKKFETDVKPMRVSRGI